MKLVYLGLLIVAVIGGLFGGYFIWGPTWRVPHEFSYDVLKDTLAIVLAVLAIGIAASGYAVYLVLSGRLRAEATSAYLVESKKGAARLFLVSGFTYWENYDIAEKKEPKYLELAIDLTERALQSYCELPESEASRAETERDLYMIKNNLAYYYAERKRPEDADIAKEYAEYIRKGIPRYPKDKENWLETYSFVQQQYQKQ